ncbi:hypothetical protein B484DRAFT_467708 [Ochromonadaceae sp. CCMP2298]|nr:hypothetical protein B484DRAFT_467708 [Ochromonadaceae sp. CCMP2298]
MSEHSRRYPDRNRKASQSASDTNYVHVHRSFSSDNRSIQTQNDEIFQETLNVSDDVEDQPLIVRNAVLESNQHSDTEEDERGGGDKQVPQVLHFKCTVRNCQYDLAFESLDELIVHHRAEHRAIRWSKKRCEYFDVTQCFKCQKIYPCAGAKCEHLQKAVGDPQSLYPKESWSITIVATKTDVPGFLLADFEAVLTELGSTLAIACLERGDKENNLHLQAAATFSWNRNDPKGLAAYFRNKLQLASKCPDLTFKIQSKVFEQGQSWLAMVGYCQKWRNHGEYRLVHRGMTPEDLQKGQIYLSVYRSDYTKDKFVVDISNILKAAYAHWSATTKPHFVSFTEIMKQMLTSGDYVVSGKMLSSAPLDKARTEQAWATLLRPYETSWDQVYAILYGSSAKIVQHTDNSTARYNLTEFTPSPQDSDLIPFLQQNLVKRRHNVVLVGPAGCGKSCLIQTLCMQHGVQYFGTADELKEVSPDVQFVVLDGFDFSQFSTDDIKRLLDREFDSQRVKVRYQDALLNKRMTRIVLCNTLPDIFEDDAVKDRAHIIQVHAPLFPKTARKKFRGTHLNDDEDPDDIGKDDEAPIPTAWSYGAHTRMAKRSHEEFESHLAENEEKRARQEQDPVALHTLLSPEKLVDLQRRATVTDE